MERHRELLLQQAMDLVWLTGSVAVRWDEFYLWTGVQRIAKKPWRVVHQVWEELCLEQGYDKALPLTVLSLDHAVVFRREPLPTENVNALEDLT